MPTMVVIWGAIKVGPLYHPNHSTEPVAVCSENVINTIIFIITIVITIIIAIITIVITIISFQIQACRFGSVFIVFVFDSPNSDIWGRAQMSSLKDEYLTLRDIDTK